MPDEGLIADIRNKWLVGSVSLVFALESQIPRELHEELHFYLDTRHWNIVI